MIVGALPFIFRIVNCSQKPKKNFNGICMIGQKDAIIVGCGGCIHAVIATTTLLRIEYLGGKMQRLTT
jgi:hypothetical protein